MFRRELLENVLTPEHRTFGLWLCEAPADPEKLNLILDGRAMASFPTKTVTPWEIKAEADKVVSQRQNK